MKEVLLKVEGMHCGGCEKRIQNAVSDIEGVEKVEASFETGIVKIIANEEVEENTLKDAINDIGFETVD